MPRKQNENLIPASARSKEEARELGRKGGIASGESRRKRKGMKESFETLFAMETTGKLKSALTKQGLQCADDLNHEQALVMSMTMRAIAGDARMASLILDVLGEKASDKLRAREIELKEKALNDTRNEPLERLDDILKGLKNEAYADEETE